MKRLLTERSSDSILGKRAFANFRKGVEREKNTVYEEEMYQALLKYFNENKRLPKQFVGSMLDFLQTGEYNDVFRGPKIEKIYRGIGVSGEWLQKFIQHELGSLGIPNSGKIVGEFDYSPKIQGNLQSWTKSPSMAAEFGQGREVEHLNDYSVVMVAKVVDNPGILVDCAELYKVAGLDHNADEKEVFSLGTVKVSKIMWKK